MKNNIYEARSVIYKLNPEGMNPQAPVKCINTYCVSKCAIGCFNFLLYISLW